MTLKAEDFEQHTDKCRTWNQQFPVYYNYQCICQNRPKEAKKFIARGLVDYNTLPDGDMHIWAMGMGDEYHTIHELYQHRQALNRALFHALDKLYQEIGLTTFIPKVYKSKLHHPDSDKPMFEGYFIVFCYDQSAQEWTSYHYDLKYWDDWKIREAEHAPMYPQGHVDSVEFFKRINWGK